MPPKVSAAETAGAAAQPTLVANDVGARREYWIQAEPVKWNIVPSGRDEMMDKKVKGKTKFAAYAYRRLLGRLRGAARARRRFPAR